LLEAKNRESTQEPELLTGVLDWLLGVNVNRSLARPIYATTPFAVLVARRPYRYFFAPDKVMGGELDTLQKSVQGAFRAKMPGL
ncbi:MAG: hypothetical protein VB143_09575, partial [Burkholderia sp.]